MRDDPNGVGMNLLRCRKYFPLRQRRIDSPSAPPPRSARPRTPPNQTPRRLSIHRQSRRRSAESQSNSAQPQSAQPTIGFVPSFSPVPDCDPMRLQAASKTVTHTAIRPGGIRNMPAHGLEYSVPELADARLDGLSTGQQACLRLCTSQPFPAETTAPDAKPLLMSP